MKHERVPELLYFSSGILWWMNKFILYIKERSNKKKTNEGVCSFTRTFVLVVMSSRLSQFPCKSVNLFRGWEPQTIRLMRPLFIPVWAPHGADFKSCFWPSLFSIFYTLFYIFSTLFVFISSHPIYTYTRAHTHFLSFSLSWCYLAALPAVYLMVLTWLTNGRIVNIARASAR